MTSIVILLGAMAVGQGEPRYRVQSERVAAPVYTVERVADEYPKPLPQPPVEAVQKAVPPQVEVAPAGMEVRQSPRPFSVERHDGKSSSGEGPATAEADQDATSSWRWTDADVPEYMTRYTPAKYTQEIAVTNGRDRISAVPRSRLEAKWRVPGGLLGIDGWVSELWQWAPRRYWVGNIPVLNSFGYFQNNRGHKVAYEPGTEFLDVLRNTNSGEVFEVRKAMKTDKGWQRFVTYRNAAERPRGYRGPKGLNCHSCHNEAGTGGYGTGLVPGGDTILSVPLDGLEAPNQG